ncbi:MAG: hypothetical protein V4795_21175 [Pseudomonadota bacterium]
MSMRTPSDASLLEAAAKLADLPLEPERLAQLVPAMDGFYALLDALHGTELGETPPAIAFHASWPGR